jgi:ABC-2 type transport system ATP-binding protein
MKVLSLDEAQKTFGAKCVVSNISFSANAGEILGFLGPNGAGKTTTIRMIMGIIAPDKGTIQYHDERGSIGKIPQEKVGYLPEERGLYKESKVMNVLAFLAGLKEVPVKRAKEEALVWLRKFGLESYAHSKVEELSKGMSQKVQFIASILHNPRLIILDEPFSGLDPVSQDLFKKELRLLAQNGAAILLSSHQMNIMEELCDRLFLIHEGKEVFSGSVQEIKELYGNYKVHLSTTQADKMQQLLNSELVDSIEEKTNSSYLISLKESVTPGEFLSCIEPESPIQELSITRSSLHDIFVKIALGREE